MNKRVDIAERLKELGCDPVEGMARIAAEAERRGNNVLAAKVYSDLLQYCAPKLKAIEHSIAPDTQQFIERQQRLDRIKELLSQIAPQLTAENVLEGEAMRVPTLKHIPDGD